MNSDKRFIEVSFPVKEVSRESAREKNIRHGHISTLHIWWARRPLASSRATNFAALIPSPENEGWGNYFALHREAIKSVLRGLGYALGMDEVEDRKLLHYFITELSKWENSNNEDLLNIARKMILDANDSVPPKVLDPFAGGGAIPLEALRLGCETYASDLNPVAVLIEKCTLEYPQKYGQPIPKKLYLKERPWLKNGHSNAAAQENEDDIELFDDGEGEMVNPLVEDVKYWGNWVLEEAKKEIGQFYPEETEDRKSVV